jgi:hypothetical protein
MEKSGADCGCQLVQLARILFFFLRKAAKDSCYGMRALNFCHTPEEAGIKRWLRVKEYVYSVTQYILYYC